MDFFKNVWNKIKNPHGIWLALFYVFFALIISGTIVLVVLVSNQTIFHYILYVTAAIYQSMDNINWAGFYFYKNGKLQLGPFQGKVACTSIEVGKGVCGTSYSRKMLLNVQDVNEFDGHIACDPDSCSELVTPIIFENKIFGVLDIDSKIYRRFGIEEEETCEAITKLIGKKLAAK